jgi:general secretion pathway protein J
MKQRHRRCPDHGFTLLELLVAMSLLVMIVSIMMGALRLAYRSVAAGERKMEYQERFRTVAAVMDAQIQSQLPLTYEAESGKANYFHGDAKNLRLTTAYSIWGGRQGYVLVDYRVEADDGGGETLYAYEQTPGIEGKRETRLFTAATEMSFDYFTREPSDDAGKWSEQWDDENLLPAAVGLHVRYGTRKLAFQFPVRSLGETAPLPMAPFSATGVLKK